MAAVIDRWHSQSLRLTLFSSESVTSDQRPTSKVYGADFESEQKNAAGDVVEIASYGVGKLVINTSGNRVDLNWNAEPHPENTVSLGTVREALNAALLPVATWLRGRNVPLVRIALGGTFHEPAATAREGYDRLAELLPNFSVDRDNTEDFALQLNRLGSVDFRGGSLRMNRICRWSVNVQQVSMFEVGPNGAVIRQLPEKFAIECNVDFNTDAKGVAPPMSGVEAAEVAQKLAENVSAFLEQGDHVEHHR